MEGDAEAAGGRRWLSWLVSLVGGGLFLWLASTQLRLLPDELSLPRPDLLWIALAVHVPYASVRAVRLSYLLDPVVAEASGDQSATMSRALVYGSGFVSFLVLLVLPFKLGELSRPLLLMRGNQPGVKLTEAVSAVATERIIDGLLICGMLFGGLALAQGFAPGVDSAVGSARSIGQLMLVAFGLALVGLLVAARFPEPTAALLRRYGGSVGPRAAAFATRLTTPVGALFDARRSVPLLVTSALYWAITVAQLWLVLAACGVALGAAQAAAIVAIIGLSIQLPGGPAQSGTFQVGAAASLKLFLTSEQVAGPGSSFVLVMYLLPLVGGALMALPGLLLLARVRSRQPRDRAPRDGEATSRDA